MTKKPNMPPRVCKGCGEDFIPETGAQRWCPPCKERRRKANAAGKKKADPTRGVRGDVSRGEQVRHTPLGLRIDERLRKRGISI